MNTIQKLTASSDFDFLRENEHLQENLLFVTYGGSHSYGISGEYSDVNIRGCSVGNRSDILGLSTFSQIVDKPSNSVIYSFFKLFSKILSGDIRMLEMLCGDPEQYACVSPLGQQVLDAKKLFFTQQAANAYMGYLNALKETLNTVDSRMNIGRQVYEKALLVQCENAVARFNKSFPDSAKVYIQPSAKDGRYIETFLDFSVEHCPVRDIHKLLSATEHIVDSMEQAAAGRNYIDKYWISKKMAEIVRVCYTCTELLETGEFKTCRKDERELLCSIREGSFVAPDGRISPKFREFLEPLEQRLSTAFANAALPAEPDRVAIDAFVMDINSQALSR